jgi:hypothetical protein
MSREKLERETGIEPATNGLGSRYSTIELLPLCSAEYIAKLLSPRPVAEKAVKECRRRAITEMPSHSDKVQ